MMQQTRVVAPTPVHTPSMAAEGELVVIETADGGKFRFTLGHQDFVDEIRADYVCYDEEDGSATVTFPEAELPEIRKQLLDAGLVVQMKDEDDNPFFSDEEGEEEGVPTQYDPYMEARRLVAAKISCLVTGPAGSGKSKLSWNIAADVALVQNRTVALVATTGMAADEMSSAIPNDIRDRFEQVGDVPPVQTFHAYFGLGRDVQEGIGRDSIPALAAKWRQAIDRRPAIRENWDRDVVIVDEISMMEAELFSLWNRVRNEMGARIQLVLVGDFCQLPPVDTTRPDGGISEGGRIRPAKFAFESEYWADVIGDNVCFLDRNYRLTDPEWVETMAQLRMGLLTEDQREEIAKMNSAQKELTDDHVWVVPKNAMAAEHNKERADRLLAEGADSRSYQRQVVRVTIDRHGGERQDITASWEDYEVAAQTVNKVVRDHGGHEEHTLMVGAKVMLTMNIDPKAHLVNGSRGTVTAVSDSSVTIDFAAAGERKIGWRTIDSAQKRGRATYTAKVRVMPVVLAFAVTINKSQGTTLDKVYVRLVSQDAHGNARLEVFQPAMVYVAMTRARGDVIVDGFELCKDRHLSPHDSVSAFYANEWQPRASEQHRTRGVPTGRINPFVDPYVLKEPPLAVTVWRDRVLQGLEYQHESDQLAKKIAKKRRQIEIAKRRQSSMSSPAGSPRSARSSPRSMRSTPTSVFGSPRSSPRSHASSTPRTVTPASSGPSTSTPTNEYC